MLYNFAKHELNVAKLSRILKYCVLNERGQFCAKIFLHYTDIVIFVLDYFIVTHPVYLRVLSLYTSVHHVRWLCAKML